MSLFIVPSRSRYSLLSEDDDATSQVSVPKPPSVRIPRATRTFQPGQICIVKESVFAPICDVLKDSFGPFEGRTGASLTTQSGKVVPVSSGKERPCIIMDAPSHLSSRRNTKKGYFICLMATFASSGGQYERLGKLLQRFVVPIEPNAQLLPDSNMYALKTVPAWRHPWQWAISVVIYTTQPVKLYTPCDGKARRLSRAEYDRLAQHCSTQRLIWEHDTQKNRNLKQEMYDEVVDWKPDPSYADNASIYTCRSNASALSLNSIKSTRTQRRRGGLATIVEDPTPACPRFTPGDFPPLSSKVCKVY
ncbi:uncharacterized protein ARMOST_04107 [Armillaria ostoyae]|uniref:Uncharacterized protein n=1 Tax=Armillaria ostoyae TaxID=47428 RepID=A0A284QWG5_ARMOS|nr:uncharacterized protein ARMOST_04107 [Armillaria ostoyae]